MILKLNLGQWKLIPGWLLEPKNFWIFAVGLLVACLLGDWFGTLLSTSATRQDEIRYAGWILDTLGLVSIALGISNKLDRFQGKHLLRFAWEQLYQWLKRFPLIKQNVRLVAGSGNLAVSGAAISAHITSKADPNWPVDKKVEWLLERYYVVIETIHKVQRGIEDKERELFSRISDMEKKVSGEIESLQEENLEAHVGDIGKEVVGLFWIFWGITFATIPEFIEASFWWIIVAFECAGLAIVSLVS